MVRVYDHFIEGDLIDSGNFNAGFENISILDIAEMIVSKIPAEIVVTESNDPRSCQQNSDKLLKTGFLNKFCVEDTVDEIIQKYNSGELKSVMSILLLRQ